ncbi:pyridoxal phosphate-dependent aminotransferase [Alicyclobacillus sp. TC]|uniref:pyridoxal phosphate-dependent aminotransferase n=1 Tax=Alicyclobacillus sp. TC TaxID=2606450 RepID=UPI001931A5A6|nr:pyridoxal phosphate-dependent aminotransferase [Alicyclobacillus sp. TC]QRF24810.1 pyridoxal phosphate-dependent aminotransferase [Alicyclobacillus sp. TC]
MSVDAKTKSLLQAGQPVINMSVGEPDFDTPTAASLAGIRAIANGKTRYTAAAGTPELRQAIAKKLQTENHLTYTPEQIVVSNGAKHTLFNIFLAILNPGDEVIVPTPYWVSYPEQIRLAGGIPVFVKTDESSGFKMTPQQLQAALNEKTKAVLLNSPCNPTGAVYSRNELALLGKILENHNAWIVSDEIYEKLVYNVAFTSFAEACPQLIDRTLLVNGFSKAFAMTGWRLGYLAAPPDLAKAVASLQSHGTGSPSTMSQAAGVAALQSLDTTMIQAFHARRDCLVKGLNQISGLSCLNPEGAFYVFPNVSAVFGKRYENRIIETAVDYAELLLEKQLVAVVPGEAFGAPNNIRLSYAVSMQDVEEAVRRIAAFHNMLN